MCDRRVAHLIADYEAARLEADEEETDSRESRDVTATEHSGLLAALRSRLAR